MAARKSTDWKEAELEHLLEEAKKVRGNSLWKDAIKRFRKIRVAVIAFCALAGLSLLCFFTPIFHSLSCEKVGGRYC